MKEINMFHASRHEFDFPDYDMLTANITNHDNGLLGLWVAKNDDWIEGFGGNIYSVKIEGETADLSIEELQSWCNKHDNEKDFYVQKRNEFLKNGISYIHLIECNGRSDMGIVIDFSAIKEFKILRQPEINRPSIERNSN